MTKVLVVNSVNNSSCRCAMSYTDMAVRLSASHLRSCWWRHFSTYIPASQVDIWQIWVRFLGICTYNCAAAIFLYTKYFSFSSFLRFSVSCLVVRQALPAFLKCVKERISIVVSLLWNRLVYKHVIMRGNKTMFLRKKGLSKQMTLLILS
jgi:hypothetical protein